MVQGQSVMVRVVAYDILLVAGFLHLNFQDSSYLSDGVGVGAIGDLGGARAVGLVRGNDLSGVLSGVGRGVGNRVGGRDASGESNSGNGELHFD